MHVGDGREPVWSEEMQERCSVELGLAFAHVGPVCTERHSPTRVKGFEDQGQRMDRADHQLDQRRQIVRVVALHQHIGVRGRQVIAPFGR